MYFIESLSQFVYFASLYPCCRDDMPTLMSPKKPMACYRAGETCEFFKQIDTYVKLLVSNNLRILVVLLEDIIDRRSNYEKMIHTYPLAGVS